MPIQSCSTNSCRNYEVVDLYELVKANKWTLDSMNEVIKGISSDLNGDGQMTEEDLYGFISGDCALGFFYAGGNMYTKKDADNIPYYDILTERSVSTFEKALKLINNDYTYSFVKGWED
ncbi:MAG: hypothetical protein FWF15_11900, partial [Oscillospiraceae bacterium]|nr:hypothetical protein [Oscillospiraceae bacterium]